MQSADGYLRYKLLPSVIKSPLVLVQTNAESKHSLSVNARIVTQERASRSEKKTNVGLHVMKEVVRFIATDQKRYQEHKMLRKQSGLPMQHTKNK